jgi:hypothetical protein
MKVLVACETSGEVRDAFRAKGHDALSCDILPSDAGGPHYQGDVMDILDEGWDLMVAHPPCTYLCSSGMHWTVRGKRSPALTDDAVQFVNALMDAPIERIAIENPVGVLSKRIRKPDQIIHPYMFGHDASKRTCLWLKQLPLLTPTAMVPPRYVCPCGANYNGMEQDRECDQCGTLYIHFRHRWANQTDSGQNRLAPSADRWKERSKTYRGIALAMAHQWR